ncbi:MAG: glycosyltransferase family 2 protein, partial [Candidatus Sifarchaeia archaeon]
QEDILTIVQHNRIMKDGQMVMKKSWGYFMNLGFKSAEGEYICMLSDDCYIHPQAIMNGYEIMAADSNHDLGGCVFPFRNSLMDDFFTIQKTIDNKYIVSFGIFKRDVLSEISWIDEDNFKFYFADIDLSLKIWEKGYKIALSPNSLVEHLRHELDQIRLINELEQKNNQDYLHFRDLWADNFTLGENKQFVEMVNLETSVPNQISRYLPTGFNFRILSFDRWLKNHIERETFLYSMLKKIKWAFARGYN